MGALHHFLGVKVVQKKETSEIWLDLEVDTRELLKKFKIEESQPTLTPVQIGSNFMKSVDEDDEDLFNQEAYQSAVSSLLYLSTRTRPDISYAVSRANH